MIRYFFLNFNPVIFSSSHISWPSFKPLVQILFEISCLQDFILIFWNGHNSRKGDNSDKKKNTGQLFFHVESIYEISKSYHARFIRYGMHQISIGFFQRGITPEREITLVSNIFPWRIHIWNFKILACTVLERTGGRTHARTHARTDARTTQNQYAPSTSSKLGA